VFRVRSSSATPGQEWAFDSGTGLASGPPSSVSHAAFFGDVEHEVAIVSGRRTTLTYIFYFYDYEPTSVRVPFGLRSPPRRTPEGHLGSGLRRVYQVEGCSLMGFSTFWGYGEVENLIGMLRYHGGIVVQQEDQRKYPCRT
jgi:hypothetical protein